MDLCDDVDTHLARTIPQICATYKFDAQIHGNVRRCGAGFRGIKEKEKKLYCIKIGFLGKVFSKVLGFLVETTHCTFKNEGYIQNFNKSLKIKMYNSLESYLLSDTLVCIKGNSKILRLFSFWMCLQIFFIQFQQ